MKRYGFLWDKVVSYDNLLQAHLAASKGKRHYRQVKKINANLEQNILELQHLLNEGKFKNAEYTSKIIMERGKEREIFSLPYWPDRVVQHAIVQVLAPIWQRSMIRGTYASIPGRGIHDAKRRVVKDLRNNPAETRYCLKIDIRKFYPSIAHGKLSQVLRNRVKDNRLLVLLDEVVNSISVTSPGIGIPIGNYLSQWFANIYLSEMDWKIKQQYSITGYHRYCDDVVIFHNDKLYLHKIRKEIYSWLRSVYQLDVKDNWQVFISAKRGIDFIGYKMWAEKILLRKSIKKRLANNMSIYQGIKSQKSFDKSMKALPSYNGWSLHGSTLNLRSKLLTPWLEMEIK